MTYLNPHISIKKLLHKGEQHIGLFFPYHTAYVQKIKSLPNKKYSKTHKCWYIPYDKESYAAFLSLGLPYQVEAAKDNNRKTAISSGTVQGSLPDQLHTAKEKKMPPPSSDLGSKDSSSTDIFRAQAGKIVIQFSRKVFIIAVAYDKIIVGQIKQLKKTWWTKDLQKWLCYGSHENLEKIQQLFKCWTPLQMEQLRIMIGAYENPKQLLLYVLPDFEKKVAVQLKGYGIDVNPIKKISGRIYQKQFRRWLIDRDG